jgi:hypothetical protein
MSSGVEQTIGRGIDFSILDSVHYSGQNALSQKLLETSVRIGDIENIKLALANGAIAEPRLLDQPLANWKESNDNAQCGTITGIFVNETFLSITHLLQGAIPGLSNSGLKALYSAFREAYLIGEYEEIVSFSGSRNFHRLETETTDFSISEYSMISDLYSIIQKLYKERIYQSWIQTPKPLSEIKIQHLLIEKGCCCICSHYCEIILSNGKQFNGMLDGMQINYLIKAIPEPDKGLADHYQHFAKYDTLISSSVEKEIFEMLGERFQIDTNEEYFEFIKEGKLNENEVNFLNEMRERKFKDKAHSCSQVVLTSIQKALAEKKDSSQNQVSIDDLEKRLVRMFFILRLEELSPSYRVESLVRGRLYKEIRRIAREITTIKNHPIGHSKSEMDHYLISQRDEIIKFDEIPYPSKFLGMPFESSNNFYEALMAFITR